MKKEKTFSHDKIQEQKQLNKVFTFMEPSQWTRTSSPKHFPAASSPTAESQQRFLLSTVKQLFGNHISTWQNQPRFFFCRMKPTVKMLISFMLLNWWCHCCPLCCCHCCPFCSNRQRQEACLWSLSSWKHTEISLQGDSTGQTQEWGLGGEECTYLPWTKWWLAETAVCK